MNIIRICILYIIQWFSQLTHANSMQQNTPDAFKPVPDLFLIVSNQHHNKSNKEHTTQPTKQTTQRHALKQLRFRWCVFRKHILPTGLAKEPPQIDLVSVKFHIGAPDAQTRQNRMVFRAESNGTSPGSWKWVKNNKTIRLASRP